MPVFKTAGGHTEVVTAKPAYIPEANTRYKVTSQTFDRIDPETGEKVKKYYIVCAESTQEKNGDYILLTIQNEKHVYKATRNIRQALNRKTLTPDDVRDPEFNWCDWIEVE